MKLVKLTDLDLAHLDIAHRTEETLRDIDEITAELLADETNDDIRETLVQYQKEREKEKGSVKIVHLVTQRNQPYGSTRLCCERCGEYGRLGDGVHFYVDEEAELQRLRDGDITCTEAKYAPGGGQA